LTGLNFAAITDNAFRTFGVASDTTRADIQAAAASVRRALKLGAALETRWDLPWLGKLERTEGSLQLAMGKLGSIDERLLARMFWFAAEMGSVLDRYDGKGTLAPIASVLSGATGHGSALLALFSRSVADPEFSSVEGWTEALKNWFRALNDEKYRAWLLKEEARGNFEPLANEADIDRASKQAATASLDLIVKAASAALTAGNEPLAIRAIKVLQNAPVDDATRVRVMSNVLGPLEEKVTKVRQTIEEGDINKLMREQDKATVNRPICVALNRQIDGELMPALAELERIAGKESDFATRARAQVAEFLANAGAAWTWADDFVESEKMLNRAKELAVGTAAEGRIAEHGAKIGGQAAIQRDNVQPIKSAPRLITVNGIGMTLYSLGRPYPPIPNLQYGTLYFVILFIPIIPLRRYLVSNTGGSGWNFHATVNFGPAQRIHLGVVLLIVLGFVFAEPIDRLLHPSYYTPYVYTPPTPETTPATPPSTDIYVPPPDTVDPPVSTYTPPSDFDPFGNLEFAPASNSTDTLSEYELRYCLSQNIRLAGARNMIDNTSDWQIDKYNNALADFKSRCDGRNYDSSTGDKVQPGVTARTEQLRSEGSRIFE
jgi:hypothetical protein